MVLEQVADLVLLNGKVITVDSKDTIAEAIAVKNGRIKKVGLSRDVRSLVGEITKVIDLKGKCVVPGFIDAHVHLDATAVNTKLAVNCYIPPVRYIEVSGSVNSVNDVLQSIKEKAQKIPKGEWIIGKGRFVQPYPTRQQLDNIAPEHPVIIHVSGHTQILNSKAFEKAKITRDSPTQKELERRAPGGKIWRDPATGEPTGNVNECWGWIFPINSPWRSEEIKRAIKRLCDEAVRFGITTIYNFLSEPESPRIYQELHRMNQLPLRIHLCPTIYGNQSTIDLDCILKLGLETGFGNEWLKFGSVKIFVDGEGIDDKGVDHVWVRITKDKLNELVAKAHKGGLRVMMHATSRDGQKMALDAVELALKEMPKIDHRHRIEHYGGGGSETNDYWSLELERLKKLGIIPVPTPYSSYGWYGDPWLDKAKPGDKIVIYRTLLNEGLMPPGNSDCVGTMPEAFNPWWSIWCVVARKTRSGKLICPEEGVTVMEAIRIYTRNSAYAVFEEEIKGSIETGKLADLVVLTEDPLTVPTDKLQDIEAEITIIGGKIVYSRNNN